MSLSIAGGGNSSPVDAARLLALLSQATSSQAITANENAAAAQVSLGARVAVAYDGASLGRAVHAGDPPPWSAETNLDALLFI